MLETLDYTIHIGSTPTFLYFDFIYIQSGYGMAIIYTQAIAKFYTQAIVKIYTQAIVIYTQVIVLFSRLGIGTRELCMLRDIKNVISTITLIH